MFIITLRSSFATRKVKSPRWHQWQSIESGPWPTCLALSLVLFSSYSAFQQKVKLMLLKMTWELNSGKNGLSRIFLKYAFILYACGTIKKSKNWDCDFWHPSVLPITCLKNWQSFPIHRIQPRKDEIMCRKLGKLEVSKAMLLQALSNQSWKIH